MFRMAAALFFLALGLSSLAQGAPNAPGQATHEELTHWLRGSDERSAAWGAYFAAKNHDEAAVPELSLLVEAWQPLPRQEYDESGNYVPRSPSQIERQNAMSQVLDALIQLHGTATAQAIEQISQDFPTQALTLFATMPEPRRTEFANAMYRTRRGLGAKYDWHEFAHDRMVYLAAAILAQHPPAGFTASLLNETTVVLNVRVTNDKKAEDEGYGLGGPCGDSPATKTDPGWPEVQTYVVEEHWRRDPLDGMTVLVPGEPAITTRRAESSSTCSGLDWFSSAMRLRLAEQEAGLPVGAIERQGALQLDSLVYPGPKAYRGAMLALISKHTERFRQFAADLERAGVLDREEARNAMPTFRIRVVDERPSGGAELPKLTSSAPTIVFDDGDEDKAKDGLVNPFYLFKSSF
jgi:hypothetical protein